MSTARANWTRPGARREEQGTHRPRVPARQLAVRPVRGGDGERFCVRRDGDCGYRGGSLRSACPCRRRVSTGPDTYGFLHEVPGYNVGEYVPGAPTCNAAHAIEGLIRLDEADYRAICEKSAIAAAKFSIESMAEVFVSALENTREFSFRISTSARLTEWFDRLLWRILRLAGVKEPTTYRYLRKTT